MDEYGCAGGASGGSSFFFLKYSWVLLMPPRDICALCPVGRMVLAAKSMYQLARVIWVGSPVSPKFSSNR